MTEEKFSELKDISIENSETEKQNKTENTHNRLYKNCETTIKVITHIVRIPEGEERMKKKKRRRRSNISSNKNGKFLPNYCQTPNCDPRTSEDTKQDKH